MTCIIAIRITAVLTLDSEPDPSSALDEIAARLRREAAHGRDAGLLPIVLPGVTVQMAAFYREHPDHN